MSGLLRRLQGKRKKTGLLCLFLLVFGVTVDAEDQKGKAIPTAPAFSGAVLTEGLDFPWEMLWGPDNMLWLTERHGLRITRVNPDTGEKKVIGRIPDAYPGPQHEGVLGMAFAPGFSTSGGDNWLYVYYTLKDGDTRWGRLVRMSYDSGRDALGQEQIVLDRLPAGDDHNAGRVRFGPDGKIYLTIGEQGHNQGKNTCLPIEAQRIPSPYELEQKNWDAYRGKSLRINPDGSIPADNPEIKGVRSHVFTYGHRNPQGLTFVGKDIYSCEHGPSSDDEINKLEAGGNYGWPHVAGFRDGQGYEYANYSAAPNCPDLPHDPDVHPTGVPVQSEMEWFDPNFKAPVKTFYTVRADHDFHDTLCGDNGYICFPTIAPSSIVYYPANGPIPMFRNSLLLTTLKSGSLLHVRMSGDAKQVQGDYDRLFRGQNRYRVLAFDPKQPRVFIATDNSGGVMDLEGRPAGSVWNPGAILVFTYNSDGSYGYDPRMADRVVSRPADKVEELVGYRQGDALDRENVLVEVECVE